MNIFVNLSHPAHFHFFKNAVRVLLKNRHKVTIGARRKEFTIDLLDASKMKYVTLTNQGKGLGGLVKELIEQQFKVANIVRQKSVDIMLQIGGIFNAPVGKYYRIPTLAFSDTENAIWDNRFSFALSTYVLSPECFDTNVGSCWNNQIFYPGYHELAYLAPRYVHGKIRPKSNFLIRFVGWGAAHDMNEEMLSSRQKIRIAEVLKKYGEVFISSESRIPEEIRKFACTFHPSEIHNFMRTCKLVVGESATMASEAACLGIPAIFISNTGRGYSTEQDEKYNLIKHYRVDQWEEIIRTIDEWGSQDLNGEWQRRRWKMLRDKIDVTAWMVDLVEDYPKSIENARAGKFDKYYLNQKKDTANEK